MLKTTTKKGASKATVEFRDFLFLSLTSGEFSRVNFPVEFREPRMEVEAAGLGWMSKLNDFLMRCK